MFSPAELPRKIVPAQLGFLAIYNPSLGTTDDTIEDQIVYYSTPNSPGRPGRQTGGTQKAIDDAIREQHNEQLRQIGLAQGMVEFGRSFSDGRAVDTVETEKSRIVLHELEAGWWILASISLTVLPGQAKTAAEKGKAAEQQDSIEYSSREVKPAIILLGDLLRAHSTFLLHHASSLSALFVRTRRSKFVGILSRYWDTFISTWNVLMHGNPANSLYGGIKIAACGELGIGVGEEERGSGERDVLEGFVDRVEGLVELIVCKFGEAEEANETPKDQPKSTLTTKWLGTGEEPAAEDGAIFLGTGALSRKSLLDVSHWVEDLYKWGPYTYGVIDNPSSNRRAKARKKKYTKKKELSPNNKDRSRQVYGLGIRNKPPKNKGNAGVNSNTPIPPVPEVKEDATQSSLVRKRPSFSRGHSNASRASSGSESGLSNRFVSYLKFGYGKHWSLGGTNPKAEASGSSSVKPRPGESSNENVGIVDTTLAPDSPPDSPPDSNGHFMIGLMGDIEQDEIEDTDPEELQYQEDADGYNSRVLLRTLTVELERDEDARAEADISIDLGTTDKDSSFHNGGSERTGTSNASFESQDRNKTKKLRVVVYVSKPFMFVFLFELRTDALSMASLYRSLHYQLTPIIKPLLVATSFRASKPEFSAADASATPIYDLVWDPKLLTINSTIPNIPNPLHFHTSSPDLGTQPWTRVEALNAHMQIINTYIASSANRLELERTSKTSRGWWVVWTRIPDPEPSSTPLASGNVKVPALIAEDSTESHKSLEPTVGLKPSGSKRTSTLGASMNSGPAHPFLESNNAQDEQLSKDKEIFLIRRASDHVAAGSGSTALSGTSMLGGVSEGGWANPGKLAQGIGVDTKRYIEALLYLS